MNISQEGTTNLVRQMDVSQEGTTNIADTSVSHLMAKSLQSKSSVPASPKTGGKIVENKSSEAATTQNKFEEEKKQGTVPTQEA